MTTNGSKPPVIKFKAYKYRYKFEIIELSEKLEAGELTEKDDTAYVAGMVTAWDFLDEDSGHPVAVGDFMELSIVQHAELVAAWREYSSGLWEEAVKKKRNGSSSSIGTS